MAVYKATYCYPYLNTLDIRVAATDPAAVPAEYLGCKIDTSNSPITGYSIRLLDDDNNQIFPVQAEHISPISELQSLIDYEENGINSGLNGTQLKIPFFQNNGKKMLESYNAIYYQPRYLVDHVLMDSQFAQTLNYSPSIYELVGQVSSNQTSGNQSSNDQTTGDQTSNNQTLGLWRWGGSEENGDQYLYFDWSAAQVLDPDVVFNKIVLDGETIMVGETVLVLIGSKNPNEITEKDRPRGDQSYSGLWIVSQHYNESIQEYELILKPIKGFNEKNPKTGRLNHDEMATLKKGDLLHNCVFKYIVPDETIDSGYFRPVAADGLWVDYAKNPISNLRVDGRFFKWEITLYQGNPTFATVTSGPSFITYDNIYEDWMDITVSGGTILGSCAERIQIANMEPDSESDDQVVLPTSTDGNIVLQGKYIDLTYIPSQGSIDIFSGTRINVKNYDASYGHVYPAANDLRATTVDQATHCQFFKHSNNPNEILETDKVKWGFNRFIDISYDENISKSFLVIKSTAPAMDDGDLFLYYYTPTSTTEAESVDTYKFGVYQYYYNSTGVSGYKHFCKRAASYSTWASYIGKIIYCEKGDLAGVNIECLAHPGTYTLWNPIATISGDSPLSFTPEMPILLFPQLLTQTVDYIDKSGKIAPENDTDATWSKKFDSPSKGYIDGDIPAIGSLFLTMGTSGLAYAELIEYNVDPTSKETSLGFKRVTNLSLPKVGDYIYAKHGASWGGRVGKYSQNGSSYNIVKSWDLYTAKILKNSLTQTYITPFINMKEGMMLKLNGGQTVTYARGKSGTIHSPKYAMIGQGTGDTEVNVETLTSQWIKVLHYNKTVSCIYHNQLECSSNGVVSRPDGTQGLASSGKTGSGFPWTYEVRSHFTTSNENSFCAFEQPYVRLYKNGLEYTGLVLGDTYDFDVLEQLHDTIYQDMYVQENDESSDTYDRFSFVYTYDESTITNSSIHLTGEYKQFNQISWESYRWLLLDDEGNILQDTGNKYKGTIDVTFYGLGNETRGTKAYYAVLFVTDDQNNTLRYIIKLNVGQALQSTAALPFTAEFDCQTHSVLLNYEDAGIVSPVYLVNKGETNEYRVYDNSNKSSDSPWDGGLLYDDGKMYVTALHNNFNRLVDYSAGSLLKNTDGFDLEHSKSIYYGVPYAVSTPRGVDTVPFDHGAILHLNDKDSGQFYFDTEIKLDDNYCGEILAVDVESAANASEVNPVVNLEEDKPDHFDNYIRFGLRLPDNFSGIKSGTYKEDVLNANRTNIELFLLTDDTHQCVYSFKKSDTETSVYRWDHKGEALSNSVLDGDIKYYLQPQRFADDKELWTGNVEFFELSGMPPSRTPSTDFDNFDILQFYIKQYGGNYFGFFGKFLGNLNLISKDDLFSISSNDLYVNASKTFQSDINGTDNTVNNPSQNPIKLSVDAPSYWVENRKKLAMVSDAGSNFHGIANTNYQNFNVYLQNETSMDMLSWPNEGADERNAYWNEGTNATGMNNYSSTWNKITPTPDNMTISPMVAMPRHPNSLSDKNFRITAQIYNVEELYKQVYNKTLVATYSYRSVDNTYVISLKYTLTDGKTVLLANFYLQIIVND